jgi:hypothetical protein
VYGLDALGVNTYCHWCGAVAGVSVVVVTPLKYTQLVVLASTRWTARPLGFEVSEYVLPDGWVAAWQPAASVGVGDGAGKTEPP